MDDRMWKTVFVAILLFLSGILLALDQTGRADPVEYTYYLHIEADSGISPYLDLKLDPPEPNPSTVAADVPAFGLHPVGEGWVQFENFDYTRDLSGNWTFTMYVFCDDDVVAGRLFARVYDGAGVLMNTQGNRSNPIGPCSDPNSPVEVIWDDALDDPGAQDFVPGERFKVEIWVDASSGGSTGSSYTASSEVPYHGQILEGTYLNTQANNEGGAQYERLSEVVIPCGNLSVFDVVAENGIEGKSTGDYTRLSANDGTSEDIKEDGTPNSVDWRWSIDITPGTGMYTFYLDAVIETVPGNDDNFVIDYSTTGAFAGEETMMFYVDETWEWSFTDPPFAKFEFQDDFAAVNTVYIRLRDTNILDSQPSTRDTLQIDRMYIQHAGDEVSCSAFEHVWAIDNLPQSLQNDLFLNAYHTISSDADDFQFRYSLSNRYGPYQDAFLLTNTTDEDYYLSKNVVIPSGISTIWVKAFDTNRVPQGSPPLDELFIDHLYLLSYGGGTAYQLHLIVDNAVYPSNIRIMENVQNDTIAPSSHVEPLPFYMASRTFDVEFSATDVGAGVRGVSLHFIDPDGKESVYGGLHESSPISFTATMDGRYQFFTIAVDLAIPPNTEPRQGVDAQTIVDTMSPQVSSTSPRDGSTDVARNAKIRIFFSESMDNASAINALMITEVDTGKAWTAGSGRVRWLSSSNDTLEFALPSGERFSYGKEYTIFVDKTAKDRAGNSMEKDFQSSFRVEEEFDPTSVLVVAAICIIALAVIILLYVLSKKRAEKEEEEVEPVSAVTPIPEEETASEAGQKPLWEESKSTEEIWKEEEKMMSTCSACGRFLQEGTVYCPFCGNKVE